MAWNIELCVGIILMLLNCVTTSYDPFVDNIPFNIVWPGAEPELAGELVSSENSVIVMSSSQEKYKCIIPEVNMDDAGATVDTYTGPSEMELLKPLFLQTSCSYRIESYWTYELCHGKSLRQYHEEKEPNQKAKLQEYVLGMYNMPSETDTKSAEADRAEDIMGSEGHGSAPTKKVEGVEIPYFEMVFTDGTLCDLTGEPRRAMVQYVCQPEGTGEIYELKETFSCGYEVIVLTSVLCSHPLYQVKKDPVNQILCHSVDGAPQQPVSLRALQTENRKAPYNRKDFYIDLGDGEEFLKDWIKHVTESSVDGEEEGEAKPQNLPTKVQVTYKPANKKENKPSSSVTSTISTASGQSVLTNFLKGEYCIHGGSGWWKHEFCFGKHINQYHKDKTQKQVIALGNWNMQRHLEWLEANPSKRPKMEERKTISLYYGEGDVCDITGNNRYTEVKLKCVASPSQPNAISIYLVEPSACTYLLVVESQLFCDILQKADHNAILP